MNFEKMTDSAERFLGLDLVRRDLANIIGAIHDFHVTAR